jgi:hypothetical protein
MDMEILTGMRNIIVWSFLPLSLLLISGCETNANVDLPEYPAKLVLSGFITPQDDTIRLRVRRSQPIFQQSNTNVGDPVTDATVILYGNNTAIQLVYNSNNQYYQIPSSVFPILAGNTYRIVVQTSHDATVDAETTVPLNPPSNFNPSVNYSSDTTSNPGFIEIDADLRYTFTDFAGESNYYMIYSLVQVYDSFLADTLPDITTTSLENDNNRDGITINGAEQFSFNNTFPQIGRVLLGTSISVLNASREYYEFHKSVLSGNNGVDPFSEPTLIFTNVNQGYGIFAGANRATQFLPY